MGSTLENNMPQNQNEFNSSQKNHTPSYHGHTSSPKTPLQPANIGLHDSFSPSLKGIQVSYAAPAPLTPCRTTTTTPLPNLGGRLTTTGEVGISACEVGADASDADEDEVNAASGAGDDAEGAHDVPPIAFLREPSRSVSPLLFLRSDPRASSPPRPAAKYAALTASASDARAGTGTGTGTGAGYVPGSRPFPFPFKPKSKPSSTESTPSSTPFPSTVLATVPAAAARTRPTPETDDTTEPERAPHDSLIRRPAVSVSASAPNSFAAAGNYGSTGGRYERVYYRESAHAHDYYESAEQAPVGVLGGAPVLRLEGVARMVEALRAQAPLGARNPDAKEDAKGTGTRMEPRANTAPTAGYVALLEEMFGAGSVLRGEGGKPKAVRVREKGRGRGWRRGVREGKGGGRGRGTKGESEGTGASAGTDMETDTDTDTEGMDVDVDGDVGVVAGGPGNPRSQNEGAGARTDAERMVIDVDAYTDDEAGGSRVRAWIADLEVLVKGKRQLAREDLKALAQTMHEMANMSMEEGRALGADGPRLRTTLWNVAGMQDIPFRDEYQLRGWAKRLLKHWPAAA